jgi:hypothetical protein
LVPTLQALYPSKSKKHEPNFITNLRISKDLACLLNTKKVILDDLIIIHLGYQILKHYTFFYDRKLNKKKEE